jgi:hypothetical protein
MVNIGKIFARYGTIIIIIILILLLLVGVSNYMSGGSLGGADGGAPADDGYDNGGQLKSCQQVCHKNGYETGYGTVTSSWECAKTYYAVSNGNRYCCCQSTGYAPPVGDCYDSDGGIDIYKWGACTGTQPTIIDSCHDQYYVNENWCQDGTCIGASMRCPDGYHCWEGACIRFQMACTSVIRPLSQRDCDEGVCDTGICEYHPPTIYGVGYCGCSR